MCCGMAWDFLSFDAAVRQVVETADVILEVLDARDPLGSRAQAVEAAVLSKAGKKIVLVLNKVCCCHCCVMMVWVSVAIGWR